MKGQNLPYSLLGGHSLKCCYKRAATKNVRTYQQKFHFCYDWTKTTESKIVSAVLNASALLL